MNRSISEYLGVRVEHTGDRLAVLKSRLAVRDLMFLVPVMVVVLALMAAALFSAILVAASSGQVGLRFICAFAFGIGTVICGWGFGQILVLAASGVHEIDFDAHACKCRSSVMGIPCAWVTLQRPVSLVAVFYEARGAPMFTLELRGAKGRKRLIVPRALDRKKVQARIVSDFVAPLAAALRSDVIIEEQHGKRNGWGVTRSVHHVQPGDLISDDADPGAD